MLCSAFEFKRHCISSMFGAGLGPLVFVVMIQKVTIPKVALFGATGRLFFTGGRPAFVVMGRLFVLSGLF